MLPVHVHMPSCDEPFQVYMVASLEGFASHESGSIEFMVDMIFFESD